MHIVKVTYTAKAEYVQHNQENIKKVMDDMRKAGNPGIRYSTYLCEDGRTFMHFALFKEKELQQVLFDQASFQLFQQELKPNIEAPPKTEVMTLVGTCFDIF